MDNIFNSKTIAILGTGNIGTYFACVCAKKGYSVKLYTSKPELFDKTLTLHDGDDDSYTDVEFLLASNDISQVMENADVLFITHPAFMFEEIAQQMLPYVKSGMYIGVIPGIGGAEFAFKPLIEKGAILFGMQRVPAVARLEKYGKVAGISGKRGRLHIASVPRDEKIAEFIADIFDVPCDFLPNYLCVTLTPSNPILHTTRLCTLFKDYKDSVVYEKNPKFYNEWSDETSYLLLACDEELQQLCKKLDKLDLKTVISLKIHYESENAEALTRKICSIKSLSTLYSPMIKVENGYIPDFNSRYFTADFPYGLAIIKQIADLVECDVPNITDTLNWYRDVTGDTTVFSLSKYGINTKENLYDFYSK